MSSTSENIAGTTNSVSSVEVMRPPITAIPIGARNSWMLSATGNMPATIATVVMMIGRARLCPASTKASKRSLPLRISSIAKSTNKIEFLPTIPISIRKPITTGIENDLPVNINAIMAPPTDSGSAERIVIGWNTRWKSTTSTANTIRTPAPIASAKLPKSSLMNSACPTSTSRTPSGSFAISGKALTLASAGPISTPLRSDSMMMRRLWL